MNIDAVEYWIQYSDFYDENWMPHITYFSTLDELNDIIDVIDVNEISNKMKEFNDIRKNKIYEMWSNLIKTKIKK